MSLPRRTLPKTPIPMAQASSKREGPGVLLLPSIYGINETIEETARAFGDAGFPCYVLNPFWADRDPGALPGTPADTARATQRAARTAPRRFALEISTALLWLRVHQKGNGKVAVFGTGWGAPYAWLAAASGCADALLVWDPIGLQRHVHTAARLTCPVAVNVVNDPATAAALQEALAHNEQATVRHHDPARFAPASAEALAVLADLRG